MDAELKNRPWCRPRMRSTLMVLLALTTVTLAGCLDGTAPESNVDDAMTPTGIAARDTLNFVTDSATSQTLTQGIYDILPSKEFYVDVNLDLLELGGAVLDLDGVQIHMGVFLPDVPEGTVVPIIADVGPYYEDGDVAATEAANRLGGFLIEQLVPHGFGVAQVSVVGTGRSDHCMDMMGTAEQAGVVSAVDFLANADFSNGNVGLIGRSYDGSTPWQAAMHAPEGLKTIVPISGLTGIPELMFFQGSAELRAAIMHNVVYGTFAVDGDLGDVSAVACPDYLASTAFQTEEIIGQWAIGGNPYFEERRFLPGAFANYEGSVYLIHGLQDWNVDPHVALPYYEEMSNRWETKLLAGQWDHAYPDRVSDHSDLPSGKGNEAFPATVRMDWAQDLLEWFTYYLKEEGTQPELVAEVQDNLGGWHLYDQWPPATDDYLNFDLDAAGSAIVSPATAVTINLGVLSETEDTHIVGLPMLYADVMATGLNGQIYARLDSVNPDNVALRLGHSVMDARFHKGGLNGEPIYPGDEFIMQMQFEALDVIVPAGHSLRLTLNGDGLDETYVSSNGAPLVLNGASSTLQLPVVSTTEFLYTPPTYTGPLE